MLHFTVVDRFTDTQQLLNTALTTADDMDQYIKLVVSHVGKQVHISDGNNDGVTVSHGAVH